MVTRFLLLLLLAAPAGAAEVAGVRIEDTAQVGNAPLVLAGAGLRKRFFVQVYAMGLYVAERKADPLTQPGAKRIAIHMLRDVGADQFSAALVDGMRPNHDAATMQGLAPRIAQLSAILEALQEAKKGMRITLDLLPEGATQVTVDGKPSGQPIPGADFYRALLTIWLGDKPVQDDLKKALLGQ